ncbi:MAG: hypothetical protein DYH06_21510, partial [Acidobacteria bacterium ACB2]|nr:hypothetical protein [Acidobacteria bacterium ACB2]
MHSALDPRAKRFLARLPLAAALALLAWFAGVPEPWGRAVVAAAEPAIRLTESPAATFLTWEDDEVLFRRSDFGTRSGTPGFRIAPVTANLVVLIALLAATPKGGGPRLRGGALALLGLFASHVLHVALTVGATYATDLGAWSLWAYPRWQRELLAGGRHFFDIALKYAMP